MTRTTTARDPARLIMCRVAAGVTVVVALVACSPTPAAAPAPTPAVVRARAPADRARPIDRTMSPARPDGALPHPPSEEDTP